MPSPTPIPRLTRTSNGFGGFTVTNFAGDPIFDPQPTPIPRVGNIPNPSPTPAPAPFNPFPRPNPSPTATPQPGDNSNLGLVSHEIRDFYNGTFDPQRIERNWWSPGDELGMQGMPRTLPSGPSTPSGTVGITPDADYTYPGPGGRPPPSFSDPNEDWIGVEPTTYTGPGGKPPGITTDPNDDWTGEDDMVSLYKGKPGEHGIPVWWDTSNQGSNRIGPQPWWVTFNPNIGNNLFTSATDLGIGTRPPAANISGGGPSTVPEPDWMKDYATVAPFDSTPAPDRTDPSFVDPGSGLEPDPSTTTSTTSTRNNTNTGGGTTSGSITPPVGTHWDFTRGTYVQNDFAGGPQHNNPVSSHADDLMTMWDQSRFQPTNRQVAPDSGRDTFAPGSAGVLDTETGILRGVQSPQGFAFSMSQKPGAPPLRLGDPKSTAVYNSWLIQQPEYKAFMQRMLGAGATPSFQTAGGPTPRAGSGWG